MSKSKMHIATAALLLLSVGALLLFSDSKPEADAEKAAKAASGPRTPAVLSDPASDLQDSRTLPTEGDQATEALVPQFDSQAPIETVALDQLAIAERNLAEAEFSIHCRTIPSLGKFQKRSKDEIAKQLAEAGCTDAQLTQNPDELIEMLDRAASSGHVKSMLFFARAIDNKYMSNDRKMLNDRVNLDRLLKRNHEHLQHAVRRGSDDAVLRLYSDYSSGLYPDPNGILAAAYINALMRTARNNSMVEQLATQSLLRLTPDQSAEAMRLAQQIRP